MVYNINYKDSETEQHDLLFETDLDTEGLYEPFLDVFSTKETKGDHVTFEIYPINRLIAFDLYVQYCLFTYKKDEIFAWYKRVSSILECILDNYEKASVFSTPVFLYRKVAFNYTKKDETGNTGRLYGKFSAQSLPREARALLFSGFYRDFDLVNSHPRILYDFARIHGLKVPSLKSYIFDREGFLDKITGSSRSEKKTKILVAMNLTLDRVSFSDTSILNLVKDVVSIRNLLWKKVKEKDSSVPDFNKELRSSKSDSIDQIKISVQAWYCQTIETKHVMKFIQFLKKEHESYDPTFNEDPFSLTDREVHLVKDDSLSLIPFFDGVLVFSSFSHGFMRDLSSIVQRYNSDVSDDLFSFEEKKLEKVYTKIKNPEIYEKIKSSMNDITYLNPLKFHNRIVELDAFPSTGNEKDVTIIKENVMLYQYNFYIKYFDLYLKDLKPKSQMIVQK